MTASGQPNRSSTRKVSTSNMANEISAARFASALVALGAAISALILATRTTVGLDEVTTRPFVGQAIAVATFGIGLVAIILFLAAWAEAWRDSTFR